MACSSARYAPIWCTATSPAWRARRPTPNEGAGARWGDVIKQIHTRMVTVHRAMLDRSRRSAWTPRWWRPTSTIRPIYLLETRAGAHSHHEEDHADRGEPNQAARPEPQREAEVLTSRARALQAKQARETQARLWSMLNSTGRCRQPKRFSHNRRGVKRSADVVQQLR